MRELTEGALLASRYTLVRRIASGGMATVWLATDKRTDGQVALKFADDVTGFEALQKEWRIGSRLMHANIIRIFEFHEDDDGPFYGMQFIDGPDMSALSRESLDVILRPVGLIADALRYAHAKEVVHRDIKASNILVDPRGAPYLVDFGIAGIVGVAAGGSSNVAASPQQKAGEAPSAADDIFSLGVLIAELISGEPPRGSEDVASLRDASGNPLPSAVSELLTEMLAADAGQRPSAEAVRERLQAAGFAPGAAPARILSAREPESERLSAAPVRPLNRPQITNAKLQPPSKSDSGISANVVYAALGILVTLLLAVTFLLPDAVDNDDSVVPAVTGTGDSQDGSVDGISDGSNEVEVAGEQETVVDTPGEPGEGQADFSENTQDLADGTPEQIKAATDDALGDLLSQLDRLQTRAVDRWGGQPYLAALDVYAEGDGAYLRKDYAEAGQQYRAAIVLLEPLFDQIEKEFAKAMDAGQDAFDNGDHINAVRSFDLAVAITPGNARAEAALARALNLKKVLDLMDQALQFENDLELDAARIAFERVLDLDGAWQPAKDGLARIRTSIKSFSFDQRMTEGLDALAVGDYASARAAFEAAKLIDPQSPQPADGLLQVDQGIRLEKIQQLEMQAQSLENGEEWETAIGVYEQILEVDGDLQFAQEGSARSRQRAALHSKLDGFITNPDALSAPRTMQSATQLLLQVSRIDPRGARLEDQKNTLSRLLKRAATPLDVMLMSDNETDVAINRVAKLGVFESRQVSMKPGVYVAVGSRPGYRDVRVEFRVAPETEMKPIVVQCEEQI